ncbi:MAG TPA: XRE family transcriptional regulator [Actinobacteria bacterium]|nr:XRE family transcriptional regulator [Actinomycetota bacterium]
MAKRKSRRSSSNVSRDLSFGPEEAENLRVRADLMIALGKLIEDRGLTQVKAAKLFGVSQPRVSDLVRGKIERFSVDTLIAMLWAAGVQVTVTTKQRTRVA